MLSTLTAATIGSDPLELKKFAEIRGVKADPKLYNVGYATRKLLTSGFIEFCVLKETFHLVNVGL